MIWAVNSVDVLGKYARPVVAIPAKVWKVGFAP
jgi:hypothetical protein